MLKTNSQNTKDKTTEALDNDWQKIISSFNSDKTNGEKYATALTKKLLGWLGESYQVDIAYARYLGTPEELKTAEENYNLVAKSGWFMKWGWQNNYKNKPYRAPTLLFEKENNLQGIAGNYKFPGNLSAEEWEKNTIQPYVELTEIFDLSNQLDPSRQEKLRKLTPIREQKLNKLNNILDSFIKINPELEKISIKRDNFTQVWDTLMGVTSLFNTDDINHFVNTKKGKRNSEVMKKRIAIIEQKLKTKIPYRPSPKTLSKIEKQLNITNSLEEITKHKKQRSN